MMSVMKRKDDIWTDNIRSSAFGFSLPWVTARQEVVGCGPNAKLALTRRFLVGAPKSSAEGINGQMASQGSSTILPPSPPASIRSWTFLAAASGSRSTTTG